MRRPGPCRNWGCPELYLGNMLFSGSCPRAALLDFPGGKSSPWQGPCCLPSPPGAAGLLFLGPTPEQALASHPSGLFVTTGPVTLPAAGIRKLSLNKLCLLASCQHDMFPEICLEEGFFFFLHDSCWCWWSHNASLFLPSCSPCFSHLLAGFNGVLA